MSDPITRDDERDLTVSHTEYAQAELQAAVAEMGGVQEEYCVKCGAPRSNHPYRHPFEARKFTRPPVEMGAVRVKPLEWRRSEMPGWNGDYHTVPTEYTIRCADENGWKWQRNGSFGYCHSAEAAKATAQADYEARILAAIETAPVSVQEAARVLCGSAETPFLEPANAITKELRQYGYLVPVSVTLKALHALAEGQDND